MSSDAWSGSEDGSTPLRCVEISLADLRVALAGEMRGWPGDTASAERAVISALDLALEAGAGCIFVVAPSNVVGQLRHCAIHVDEGYMTKKLKDEKIWSEEFRRVFLQFAARSETCLWPRDHPDAAARGQPKEGAIVVSGSGGLRRAAVTLAGLPQSENTWPGHGTRHTAALQAATFLEQAVVIVKSDGGGVHALLGRPAKSVASFHLRAELAEAQRMPKFDGDGCVEPPVGKEGWQHVLRRRLRDVIERQPTSEEDVRAAIAAGEAAELGEADLRNARRALLELEARRSGADVEPGRPSDPSPSNPQDAS